MNSPGRQQVHAKDLYYCPKCQRWKHFRQFKSRLEGAIPCLSCSIKPPKHTSFIQRNRSWVARYKALRGCLLCREQDPVCLDLHHVDPSEKDTDVARLLATSMKKIRCEVAKCIVICANCHRRLHRWQRQPSAAPFLSDLRAKGSTPAAFKKLIADLSRRSPIEFAKLVPSRPGSGFELMELRGLVARQTDAIVTSRALVASALAGSPEAPVVEVLEAVRRALLG
jgi:hypothetical protein